MVIFWLEGDVLGMIHCKHFLVRLGKRLLADNPCDPEWLNNIRQIFRLSSPAGCVIVSLGMPPFLMYCLLVCLIDLRHGVTRD